MEWHEDKQVLLTSSKDKSFKIWQFPPVWVDEEDVDLQRAPDSSKARKPKAAPMQSNGSAAAS